MLPTISSVINPLIISPGYLLAATSVCPLSQSITEASIAVVYTFNLSASDR